MDKQEMKSIEQWAKNENEILKATAQKIVDKIEALPMADIYVMKGDIRRDEAEHLRRLWHQVQKDIGREVLIIFMSDSVDMSAMSKEDLKSHLNDIIERL